MARKKSFSGGINSLLEGTGGGDELARQEEKQPARRGRPKKNGPQSSTVASFVINHETLEVMRALAYWERKKIKDILEEAVRELVAKKGNALVSTACREYRNQEENS
ncbi:hypothetical protein [Prosthecochloris sp. HL-130-GSB]|jgi:hypothetical protein|uniref:hypothetical protein n=1 Tax=Prosthecochloris sp. HL-130-GSB TaxID=1974213 RepID=UPI000A1C05FB|nr:hypothetical protein [Prosthecochloris sp. HL-130-GSB]ARM30974.1 hypothetical protein B9H02_06245 [Prosthecochloris sp. HL-130-GSB]